MVVWSVVYMVFILVVGVSVLIWMLLNYDKNV